MKFLEKRPLRTSRSLRYDRFAGVFEYVVDKHQPGAWDHIRRGGDGSCLAISQAFHAWLPTYGPFGTKLD